MCGLTVRWSGRLSALLRPVGAFTAPLNLSVRPHVDRVQTHQIGERKWNVGDDSCSPASGVVLKQYGWRYEYVGGSGDPAMLGWLRWWNANDALYGYQGWLVRAGGVGECQSEWRVSRVRSNPAFERTRVGVASASRREFRAAQLGR